MNNARDKSSKPLYKKESNLALRSSGFGSFCISRIKTGGGVEGGLCTVSTTTESCKTLVILRYKVDQAGGGGGDGYRIYRIHQPSRAREPTVSLQGQDQPSRFIEGGYWSTNAYWSKLDSVRRLYMGVLLILLEVKQPLKGERRKTLRETPRSGFKKGNAKSKRWRHPAPTRPTHRRDHTI